MTGVIECILCTIFLVAFLNRSSASRTQEPCRVQGGGAVQTRACPVGFDCTNKTRMRDYRNNTYLVFYCQQVGLPVTKPTLNTKPTKTLFVDTNKEPCRIEYDGMISEPSRCPEGWDCAIKTQTTREDGSSIIKYYCHNEAVKATNKPKPAKPTKKPKRKKKRKRRRCRGGRCKNGWKKRRWRDWLRRWKRRQRIKRRRREKRLKEEAAKNITVTRLS